MIVSGYQKHENMSVHSNTWQSNYFFLGRRGCMLNCADLPYINRPSFSTLPRERRRIPGSFHRCSVLAFICVKTMNHPPKDPFEVAYDEDVEEQELQQQDMEGEGPLTATANDDVDDDATNTNTPSIATTDATNDEDEEEEDTMDIDVSKFPSSTDPDKVAKMQAILSQFTPEQMERYEKFRRSGFKKANIRKLLVGITGNAKIESSSPETIVVSGIAKMFVGDLVETARIVMRERKEIGPARPCHIREAYRRLKLEGKLPKRSVPRLFR